jgi:outer membrane murein-binding lipoprotein Lpp
MFNNIFKKSVEVLEPKQKTVNELVQEIHENFFTEVDRLFVSAQKMNSLETDKQELINKCERLKKLGFYKTKEVKDAEEEINRLNTLKTENEKNENLFKAINFFSVAYPCYKFITEESVKKICEKYGLVYGEIKFYKGTVPDKNLEHIEKFKINSEYECYTSERRGFFTDSKYTSYIGKRLYEYYQNNGDRDVFAYKSPLEIVAPAKDFDMKGMDVKNFKVGKIPIPDPIVLKPIIFNGEKHYLIVTAWGEEASDEMVVNQQMN